MENPFINYWLWYYDVLWRYWPIVVLLTIIAVWLMYRRYAKRQREWDENADNLQLADMKPKVNYKAGDDIAAAVKGASLSWTTEAETDENTVTDDDNTNTGNQGGGTTGGELEG